MDTLDNGKLRPTRSWNYKIIDCIDQLQSDLEFQRIHSHKECFDFLDYYLKTASPAEDGNKHWVTIAPDYSLLAQQSPADGPGNFDSETDPLKLAALELAVSVIEKLPQEIAWADHSGNSWRNTVIFRLLLSNC